MAAIYDNLTLNVRFNTPSETTTTVAQRQSEDITESLRTIREMRRARSLERPIIRQEIAPVQPIVIQQQPPAPIYNSYYYRPPAHFYQKTRTSSYHTFHASPYTGYHYASSPWYNHSGYYPYSGLSAEAMGALSELERLKSFRYNSDVFPVHSSWPYNDYYPYRSYVNRHLY